jgi:GH24 family phage-related lysozyme (muramidase)
MDDQLNVPEEINDNQYSAMLSFAYNVGRYKLARVLAKVGYYGFPEKIQEYVFSRRAKERKPHRLAGLVKRRAKEAELYETQAVEAPDDEMVNNIANFVQRIS